mmetsp:Transcript_25342/g.45722  ORF Transcript_25342/g.45722 Transcript_25342/m.45722 type:complete len:101 (+) Transcript_25342:59-361(+)
MVWYGLRKRRCGWNATNIRGDHNGRFGSRWDHLLLRCPSRLRILQNEPIDLNNRTTQPSCHWNNANVQIRRFNFSSKFYIKFSAELNLSSDVAGSDFYPS